MIIDYLLCRNQCDYNAHHVATDIITKLVKGRGINYNGGREFHNLIVEGKNENLYSPFDNVAD